MGKMNTISQLILPTLTFKQNNVGPDQTLRICSVSSGLALFVYVPSMWRITGIGVTTVFICELIHIALPIVQCTSMKFNQVMNHVLK